MSLFVTSRILRAPLRAPTSMVYAPLRTLHTTNKVQALPWAKQAPTTTITEAQDLKQLNEQRNDRPISPHLEIYQPQLTWYSSILHRMTGVGLSAGLYAFSIGYLAAPYVGLGEVLSSQTLVNFVSQWPEWAKVLAKVPLGAAFSYHFLNGLRHLAWDMGWCTTLRSSYAAGYTVLALTGVSTVGLLLV